MAKTTFRINFDYKKSLTEYCTHNSTTTVELTQHQANMLGLGTPEFKAKFTAYMAKTDRWKIEVTKINSIREIGRKHKALAAAFVGYHYGVATPVSATSSFLTKRKDEIKATYNTALKSV